VFLPSRHHHQFPCATACIFYLISDGPLDIHYVDPDGKEIQRSRHCAGHRNHSPDELFPQAQAAFSGKVYWSAPDYCCRSAIYFLSSACNLSCQAP
jgi:hypothetical protein